MANHYLAKVSVQLDTTLPRDAININPCFRDNLGLTDAGNLANDLAVAMKTFIGGGATPINVKVYDLQGTPPVYPAGQKTLDGTAAPLPTSVPREVALCLSFFGSRNVPRERGRLYVPAEWVVGGSGLMSRPTSGQRTKAGTLSGVLAGLGGANIDWIVWSRVGLKATKVENWFVDDEWDIVRRRGLRGTARTTGTVSG